MPESRAWHLLTAVSIRSSSGWRSAAARALDQLDAAAPGQHQERDDAGEQQRKPAALEQLDRVRGEENAVDHEEEAVDRDHDDRRIAPLDRDQRRQQRGDRHQQRHRDAIGAGERVRRAEADHRAERRRRQQPVHQRHIDLAHRVAGGVADMHARQEAELDRLLRQREHARDDRLRGDHGGEGGERDQRVMHPVRRELVERIIDRAGVGDQQRRLPEIVQHQRRQRDGEPGEPDRHPAEMPHVGVHRLAAGHGQEGGAEDGEADVEILVDQEIEGIERAERCEHRRRLDDAVDAEQRQGRRTSRA